MSDIIKYGQLIDEKDMTGFIAVMAQADDVFVSELQKDRALKVEK